MEDDWIVREADELGPRRSNTSIGGLDRRNRTAVEAPVNQAEPTRKVDPPPGWNEATAVS